MAGIRKGAEAVAVALASTFTSYLSAEIDAVQSAWNDSIALPHMKKVFSEDRLNVPEYPALLIVMRGGQQTANGAYSEQTGWAQMQHQFEATIFIEGDKLEILERQSRRYSVAMWEVLMKHQDLDGSLNSGLGGSIGVDPLQWTFNPVATDAKNKMLLLYAVAWRGVVYLDESV